MRARTPARESNALIRTLHGHTDRVGDCAISPDGTCVASAGDDGTIRLWDPAGGRELSRLETRAAAIEFVATRSGSFLAAADGRLLTLLDIDSGREVHSLDCGEVIRFAFSADARLVLTAGDRELKLWNLATSEELHTLRMAGAGAIFDCALSLDGRFAVSAGGVLLVYDTTTGELHRVLHGDNGHTAPVRGCALSPDGSFVLSASKDGTLKQWDPVSGEEIRTLRGHTREVSGCAVSADARLIVSSSWDQTLKLWDARNGRELRTLAGHASWVEPCAVSPDGSFVVSASYDATLRLWNPRAEPDLRSCRGHASVTGDGAHVNGCAFSPDGAFLVTASSDNTLQLWDPARAEPLRTLRGHTSRVLRCAVSPDAAFIASLGEDRCVKLWDPQTGRELLSCEDAGWSQPHHWWTSCAVDRDGAVVVSATSQGLIVWDVASGEQLSTLEGHSCAATPDGAYFVLSGKSGASLWDPPSGRTIRPLPNVTGTPLAVSPDGSFVVSTAKDALTICDIERGHEHRVIGRGVVCAVSPDGRLVAAGGDRLALWDARDGQELASIPVASALCSVAFHPTQALVAGGDLAGNVYLVDLVGG